jgi:hypothetical protein
MLTSDAATDCVYNPKQKPGLKPGAVEALTRRVGTRLCDHDFWSLSDVNSFSGADIA